jgi:hypothetical protein
MGLFCQRKKQEIPITTTNLQPLSHKPLQIS